VDATCPSACDVANFIWRPEVTSLAVFTYELQHVGPPVIPWNKFKGLPTSRMACNLWVVVLFSNPLLQIEDIQDVDFIMENTRGHPPVSTHQHEVIYCATLLSQLWPGQLHPLVAPSRIPCQTLCAMSHSGSLKGDPLEGMNRKEFRVQKCEVCDCHWFLYHGQPVTTMHHICPLWPRWWCITKLNWDRYRDHCACHWLSFFTVMKYSRFL